MLFDPIRYIALLGPREEPQFPNVPQDYLNAFPMWILGFLPQSMFHFIYGIEQYSMVKAGSLQLGYDLLFTHPDITAEHVSLLPWNDLDTPIVLLLCTEDKNSIEKYNSLLVDIVGENVLCIIDGDCASVINIPSTATDEKTIWDWFTSYAFSHYKIEGDRLPFSVPLLSNSLIDMGCVFSPSRVNTQTLNSILGNWGFRRNLSKDEIISQSVASSSQAILNKDGSDRQEILLEQIKKMRNIEDIQARRFETLPMMEEHYRAPLVIAVPYTSVDMRKLVNKSKLKGEEARMASILERIMDADYTKSYAVFRELGSKQNFDEIFAPVEILRSKVVETRMRFFDEAAMLHCSIRFSPYFRLPMLGKNISAELSYVGIKNVNKVATGSGRNHGIREAMEKVGEKIASTALCQQTVSLLKDDCSQVVVMTDLPIEWMMLDGVPLGFSHDVCRLPESPIQSLLSQYEANKYNPYIIPQDIIKRTLVVYGNNDPSFELMQGAVEMLKKRLGFQTCRCLSRTDFINNVNLVNPELLIIDAHGGVEEKTHQSYIMMGNDKVTGCDIVGSGIHPQLVFLSACNTYPTYNSVSTIANAFFESGSYSVTTSYMPLEIQPATTLYCRLLANLDMAAKKMMHKNWLAFMSHLLRTSYLQAPMFKDIDKMTPALSAKLAKLTTDSMLFYNRRKIYEELNTNEFTEGMGADYKEVIPHYLMYSILGRADLIRFQSFIDEVNGEIMPYEEFVKVYQDKHHDNNTQLN